MILWRECVRSASISASAAPTYLNWPLPQDAFHGESPARFSRHLLDLEQHWKERCATPTHVPSYAEKKYVLSMFPYPSGNLHMGHMRVYTISDVTARYFRLNGFNVVHPIGWDAFGLPAENAARERGVDPKEWTYSNIRAMKEQLLKTGVHFDWDRELFTCDPSFYRWTQWIFCRLFEKGLVKRKLAEVNWDPIDGTVLAAEQIDSDGRSWRSGAIAEKRKLRQWMVETPRYAQRLLEGLQSVSQWHEVADIQNNWIGPCDVYRYLLPIREEGGTMSEELFDLRLFDPIALSQCGFVVVRQGHSLSNAEKSECEQPYVSQWNVLNGVTGQWIPVIVVPKSYQGPEMCLDARCGDATADAELVKLFGLKATSGKMRMNFNDVQEISAFGGYGGYLTSRTLQDWVVSRQRAWGTPIPMIISEDGKQFVCAKDDELPILQGSCNGQLVKCDRLPNGVGYVERDTLDTFFDSSWYFLRYLDSKNDKQLISPTAAKRMPVDVYVGGIEHAAVHMFFARFISYFLADIDVIQNHEPFLHLIPQGMVRGKTLVEKETGRYVKNEETKSEGKKLVSSAGKEVEVQFEKMSKSKHNGVDPLVVLDRDGIDMSRLQLLSAAAPRAPINWGEADLKGLNKWLDRIAWVVSTYVQEKGKLDGKLPPVDAAVEEELKETYNYFVRNVSMCLELLNLHNTALARLQGLSNALRKLDPTVLGSSREAERCIYALIVMLQVFAPHSAAEFWTAFASARRRGATPLCTNASSKTPSSVEQQYWPQVDEDGRIDFSLLVNDVNCGRITVDRQDVEKLSTDELLKRARTNEHREMLMRLEQGGFKISRVARDARPGFHVTLTVTLDGDVTTKQVSDILSVIQGEKRQAEKRERQAAKAKKNKKSVVNES